MLRASLGGEHAENACATSNVQDSLSLEELWVIEDRIAVSTSPDSVLQHLLVNS